MEGLQRTITLPLWQHGALMLVGSITFANLWKIYDIRNRTKNVRAKKVYKTKEVTAEQCATEISEDLRDEGDSGSEYESDEEEEVLEGEILNFEIPTEPYKMVLCVNTSLKKMDKGKAMAQCGHATLGAYRMCEKYAPSNLRHWMMFGQAKIAVKCSEEEMLLVAQQARSKGIVSYTVMDAGRTQIPAGSKTVCAIGPAPQSMLDEISGKFKLM